jgi:hypothetical protein
MVEIFRLADAKQRPDPPISRNEAVIANFKADRQKSLQL